VEEGENTMSEKPQLHGLWRDNPETPEGKYLVLRRDGTVVEWPHFVMGARDPFVPAALRAYATAAWIGGADAGFARAVIHLADEFEQYRKVRGEGDPDKGKHRPDDPETIKLMKKGMSS
jgi:hypothetical protein